MCKLDFNTLDFIYQKAIRCEIDSNKTCGFFVKIKITQFYLHSLMLFLLATLNVRF